MKLNLISLSLLLACQTFAKATPEERINLFVTEEIDKINTQKDSFKKGDYIRTTELMDIGDFNLQDSAVLFWKSQDTAKRFEIIDDMESKLLPLKETLTELSSEKEYLPFFEARSTITSGYLGYRNCKTLMQDEYKDQRIQLGKTLESFYIERLNGFSNTVSRIYEWRDYLSEQIEEGSKLKRELSESDDDCILVLNLPSKAPISIYIDRVFAGFSQGKEHISIKGLSKGLHVVECRQPSFYPVYTLVGFEETDAISEQTVRSSNFEKQNGTLALLLKPENVPSSLTYPQLDTTAEFGVTKHNAWLLLSVNPGQYDLVIRDKKMPVTVKPCTETYLKITSLPDEDPIIKDISDKVASLPFSERVDEYGSPSGSIEKAFAQLTNLYTANEDDFKNTYSSVVNDVEELAMYSRPFGYSAEADALFTKKACIEFDSIRLKFRNLNQAGFFNFLKPSSTVHFYRGMELHKTWISPDVMDALIHFHMCHLVDPAIKPTDNYKDFVSYTDYAVMAGSKIPVETDAINLLKQFATTTADELTIAPKSNGFIEVTENEYINNGYKSLKKKASTD